MVTEFAALENSYVPQLPIISAQLCQDLVSFTFVSAMSNTMKCGLHFFAPLHSSWKHLNSSRPIKSFNLMTPTGYNAKEWPWKCQLPVPMLPYLLAHMNISLSFQIFNTTSFTTKDTLTIYLPSGLICQHMKTNGLNSMTSSMTLAPSNRKQNPPPTL